MTILLILLFAIIGIILWGLSNKKNSTPNSREHENKQKDKPGADLEKKRKIVTLLDTNQAKKITISSTIKETVTKKDDPKQDWDAYWKIFNRGVISQNKPA